jgi:hypothetical protein
MTDRQSSGLETGQSRYEGRGTTAEEVDRAARIVAEAVRTGWLARSGDRQSSGLETGDREQVHAQRVDVERMIRSVARKGEVAA